MESVTVTQCWIRVSGLDPFSRVRIVARHHGNGRGRYLCLQEIGLKGFFQSFGLGSGSVCKLLSKVVEAPGT
jgi:hypothetical protein